MFLLRHGQSYFNLHFNKTRVDPGIEDPELTALGAEQAAAAAAQLADVAVTRIIISPYTRALQTALASRTNIMPIGPRPITATVSPAFRPVSSNPRSTQASGSTSAAS